MWDSLYAVVTGTLLISASVLSAGHALLNKRDPRSQLGWVVLCVLVLGFGPFFYWLLGVNRIRTRARRWQAAGRFDVAPMLENVDSALFDVQPVRNDNMGALLHLSSAVTGRPLIGGNAVTPLHNGEQAYPAMLEAIAAARHSVNLCTYIFETDDVTARFVDALRAAGERGVHVRVLIDAIGERYARRPRLSRQLRGAKNVEVARFLPLTLSLRGLRVNLRNHRKILTVDGETGFTGGMNIGGRHMVEAENNKNPTVDLHFRIDGPGVGFLDEAFFADWQFTTGGDDGWAGFPGIPAQGTALCRGISDGPNEDFEKLQWILTGALSAARDSVRIMTPYFIPNRELLGALSSAALRGVNVEIILPRHNNLPFVAWATNAMLWEMLQRSVKFYLRPGHFAHSKLFVVDDYYINIGSANLDPRSLRLNFEFNLEIFDSALGAELRDHFEAVRAESHMLTLDEMDNRSFLLRLRDSTAKIFSPYL